MHVMHMKPFLPEMTQAPRSPKPPAPPDAAWLRRLDDSPGGGAGRQNPRAPEKAAQTDDGTDFEIVDSSKELSAVLAAIDLSGPGTAPAPSGTPASEPSLDALLAQAVTPPT